MNSFQPPISSATIEQLGSTLARRVFRLREIRNITQKELSKRSRFTMERIQDIESGVETWLSSSDRQLLARALVVDPYILQEVETRSLIDPLSEGNKLELIHADIADSIATGMRELECPICGDILRCRLQEGLDMQGQVIYLPKAFCQKCPFVLK